MFLTTAMAKLKNIIIKVAEDRKKNPVPNGEELFIDLILDHDEDEERQLSDTISYVVGGFHTTGNGKESSSCFFTCSCKYFWRYTGIILSVNTSVHLSV